MSAAVDEVDRQELVERRTQRFASYAVGVSELLRQCADVRGDRLRFQRQLMLAASQRDRFGRPLRPDKHEPVPHQPRLRHCNHAINDVINDVIDDVIDDVNSDYRFANIDSGT